jgi:hypothetical protein
MIYLATPAAYATWGAKVVGGEMAAVLVKPMRC